MHGICFPGKSDKLCPQMAAKMIHCNLFQPTAKASSWTSRRNCKYGDKDTIPRWLAHPLRKHCRVCPTEEPSQTGSASAWDWPWIRAFAFRQVPSRCFNLILRLLYFFVSVWRRGRRGAKLLIQSGDGKSSQRETATNSTSCRLGGKWGEKKTATCPVWIHPMWKQRREDNHFKRLN